MHLLRRLPCSQKLLLPRFCCICDCDCGAAAPSACGRPVGTSKGEAVPTTLAAVEWKRMAAEADGWPSARPCWVC